VLTINPPHSKAMSIPQQDFYGILDPALLRAGIDIYSFYCQINPDRDYRRQPIGVAMNRLSYRGKLIFSTYPILLPQECFISIDRLEAEFN
jgi:hypothetical protein